MYSLEILLPLLFIVAILYSAVGHGGASGYLACMALVGISPLLMRPSALMLNLIVSGITFYNFYKAGYFKWQLLWPFVITSVPASFIGALLEINSSSYNLVLGICLLFAVGRIIYKPGDVKNIQKIHLPLALVLGLILGLLSGIIGIGGGIILSPLLILFSWSTIKQSAAVSSIFIFLNSASGLIGFVHKNVQFDPVIIHWILVVFIGGLIGSYLGSRKFSILGLKYILATVLCFAAIKLIFFN